MIAKTERGRTLEDVLAKIAALSSPPDAQQLRGWLNRYPEFKAGIIEFVTDWVDMDASRVPHEVSTEDVNLVVNRTMSRVQQLLDEAQKPADIQDLAADISAAGHDLESFQRKLGIDHSMLTCLIERMVRPPTIPLRLVRDIAEGLRRSIERVRAYFRLPPRLAAAYKARSQPTPKQVDFAYIVQHADLPDSEKAKWLAEAPDPALRD
jgi:hypothetical protein